MQHPAILQHLATLVPLKRGARLRPRNILVNSGLQTVERLFQPLINLAEYLISLTGPLLRTNLGSFHSKTPICVSRTLRHKPRISIVTRKHQTGNVTLRTNAHKPQRLIRIGDTQTAHLMNQRHLQQGHTGGDGIRHAIVPPVGGRQRIPHHVRLSHILVHQHCASLLKRVSQRLKRFTSHQDSDSPSSTSSPSTFGKPSTADRVSSSQPVAGSTAATGFASLLLDWPEMLNWSARRFISSSATS